jgi:Alkaline phosphatase PhoX
MRFTRTRLGVVVAGAAAMTALGATAALGNAITGPSSSESPYLVRAQPGVVTKSILTVGDAVGDYRMVGIPDGLGAYDNGDGTFTLLANQELRATNGIVRDHGAKGAFVSKWTIDKETLEVTKGEDLIQQVAAWNTGTSSWNAPAKGVTLARLCSATLGELTSFYNPATGKGYDGRLFTDGEEDGDEGQAYAHALDGTSYEIPAVGKMSFENVAPHPDTGDRTVVADTDDTGGGQVYLYAGDKQSSGNPVERAGLANGHLFGVKVDGLTSETDASSVAPGTRFTGVDLGDVRNKTGAQIQSASVAAGVTGFNRPEDSAWDPTDARVLYFVTTASFAGKSRLWKLTLDDPSHPEQGGTIDELLDGSEGQHMLDNLTVDNRGNLLIQEDPGGNDHLAKVWRYWPDSDRLEIVAKHDPDRFLPGGDDFLTNDEESSGVIDASSILGDGWFLGDVQAHYAKGDPELVEGGQLLALHVPAGRTR